MRLLVLTTRLFDKPGSGGEICTARLLDGLREAGHEIVLAGRGDAALARRWANTVIPVGDIERPFDEQPRLRRLYAVVSALSAGRPVTVHRQGGAKTQALVAPLLASCDAAIVDHLQVWPWLGAQCDKPVMLVNHNVESDNYMRHSRAANRGCHGNPSTRPATRFLMRREAYGLRAMELDALAHADVVACLSEGDAERLRRLAAMAKREVRARLAVLPGYPRTPRAEVPPRPPRERPCIGLIGTWTWAPNRQGLRWLIDHVWPSIGHRAELVLAGGGLEGMALPPGTRVLGRVADAQAFYDAVDVIAVPSLSGSGVQEKAIEAIGTGLPVVATTHALRGLSEALPAQVRMADSPAAFAQACLDVPATAATQVRGLTETWSSRRRAEYTRVLGACMNTLLRDQRHGDNPSLDCAAAAL